MTELCTYYLNGPHGGPDLNFWRANMAKCGTSKSGGCKSVKAAKDTKTTKPKKK